MAMKVLPPVLDPVPDPSPGPDLPERSRDRVERVEREEEHIRLYILEVLVAVHKL